MVEELKKRMNWTNGKKLENLYIDIPIKGINYFKHNFSLLIGVHFSVLIAILGKTL